MKLSYIDNHRYKKLLERLEGCDLEFDLTDEGSHRPYPVLSICNSQKGLEAYYCFTREKNVIYWHDQEFDFEFMDTFCDAIKEILNT